MLFNLNLNLLISQEEHKALDRIALSTFIQLAGIACDIPLRPGHFPRFLSHDKS